MSTGRGTQDRYRYSTCPRYTAARENFSRTTGITLCEATYTDVMAINYKKLQVDKTVLAKALCALLAQIAREHTKHNKRVFASERSH